MTKTKFRPILFSTPMVQAILENRKTMTRRVVKPTPIENENYHFENLKEKGNRVFAMVPNTGVEIDNVNIFPYNGLWVCPYEVGDVLWVRESFYAEGYWEPCGKTKTGKQKYQFVDDTMWSHKMPDHGYKYLNNAPKTILKFPSSQRGYYKRNSLFMPKSACRIFLKIKSIRVERLQDISENDAIAEGVKNHSKYQYECYLCSTKGHIGARAMCEDGFFDNACESFRTLWKSINGQFSWHANPFVWVYEFERIEKPLDFIV